MIARRGELIATDESTVVSELFPDLIVVENSKSDGRFPNSPWTDESDWSEVFCETDDLFDQLVAPETGPWRRWRRLSEYARCRCKVLDSLVVKAANLV